MKRTVILSVLSLVGVCGTVVFPVQAETANAFKVGAVKVDITPKNLTDMNPMGGNFTHVHDPIYLRTLLIETPRTKAALLSVDAIEVGNMTATRHEIAKQLGIPFDHIMIVATHDHSAPRVGNVSPGALAHDGTATSNRWSKWLYGEMISSLKQAEKQAKPATFGVGRGRVDVNVNRDEYTSKGWTIGFNPDGPSDKTVWVMKFDDLKGKPIAVVSNYAIHSVATLGTNQVSGDIAGRAARYVETQLGNQAISLWTLGSVADQNPRIFYPDKNRTQPSVAWDAMDAQGIIIGDEIVRVADHIQNMTPFMHIAAQEKVVQCPVKRGVKDMDNINQTNVKSVDLRLGLMMFNQTALAGVSGEVVTNIERRLQADSPLKNTILVSIANDRIGYLPANADYDRAIFEVQGSPVQRGCAENAIVNDFPQMIRQVIEQEK